MSESTEPQSRTVPTPEEMPWSISYLHDGIQDLRVEVRGLRDEVRTDIQNLRDEVRTDTQNLRDEVRTDIQNLRDETNNRIDETNREIRALHKRMDTYFLWMMGTLITITGVLIAVIKL